MTNRSPRGSGHPSRPSSPLAPIPALPRPRVRLSPSFSRGPLLPFSLRDIPTSYKFTRLHTGGTALLPSAYRRTPFGDSESASKRAGEHGGGNDECLSYANGSRQRARDDDGKKRPLRGRGRYRHSHSAISTLARWSSRGTMLRAGESLFLHLRREQHTLLEKYYFVPINGHFSQLFYLKRQLSSVTDIFDELNFGCRCL